MEEKSHSSDPLPTLDVKSESTTGLSQEELYSLIYSVCQPSISAFINEHEGFDPDVDDVLHDTFVLASTRMAAATLKQTESLPNFLVCVARGLWITELRRRQCRVHYEAELQVTMQYDDADCHSVRRQCYNLYWTHFKNLNDICRKMINSAFRKSDSKKTRHKLGLTYDYYYKKKSTCLKMLLQQIKKDPNYNRIMISQ